jgi:ribosome-associated translation inhibitor RaiA
MARYPKRNPFFDLGRDYGREYSDLKRMGIRYRVPRTMNGALRELYTATEKYFGMQSPEYGKASQAERLFSAVAKVFLPRGNAGRREMEERLLTQFGGGRNYAFGERRNAAIQAALNKAIVNARQATKLIMEIGMALQQKMRGKKAMARTTKARSKVVLVRDLQTLRRDILFALRAYRRGTSTMIGKGWVRYIESKLQLVERSMEDRLGPNGANSDIVDEFKLVAKLAAKAVAASDRKDTQAVYAALESALDAMNRAIRKMGAVIRESGSTAMASARAKAAPAPAPGILSRFLEARNFASDLYISADKWGIQPSSVRARKARRQVNGIIRGLRQDDLVMRFKSNPAGRDVLVALFRELRKALNSIARAERVKRETFIDDRDAILTPLKSLFTALVSAHLEYKSMGSKISLQMVLGDSAKASVTGTQRYSRILADLTLSVIKEQTRNRDQGHIDHARVKTLIRRIEAARRLLRKHHPKWHLQALLGADILGYAVKNLVKAMATDNEASSLQYMRNAVLKMEDARTAFGQYARREPGTIRSVKASPMGSIRSARSKIKRARQQFASSGKINRAIESLLLSAKDDLAEMSRHVSQRFEVSGFHPARDVLETIWKIINWDIIHHYKWREEKGRVGRDWPQTKTGILREFDEIPYFFKRFLKHFGELVLKERAGQTTRSARSEPAQKGEVRGS